MKEILENIQLTRNTIASLKPNLTPQQQILFKELQQTLSRQKKKLEDELATEPPPPKTTTDPMKADIQTTSQEIMSKFPAPPPLTQARIDILTSHLHQKKKDLAALAQKHHAAHLHKHIPELKLTPFQETMGSAWKLLQQYKNTDT